jgi:hypothetical protein
MRGLPVRERKGQLGVTLGQTHVTLVANQTSAAKANTCGRDCEDDQAARTQSEFWDKTPE